MANGRRNPYGRVCKEKNCPAKVYALDRCTTHYQTLRRAGLTPSQLANPKQCATSDCSRPAYCRDLCASHYTHLTSEEREIRADFNKAVLAVKV